MPKHRHKWPKETKRWVWHQCLMCPCMRVTTGYHATYYCEHRDSKTIMTTAPSCVALTPLQKDIRAYIAKEMKVLNGT